MPETTSTPQPYDEQVESVALDLYAKAANRSHAYDEDFALHLWEKAGKEVREHWRAIARDARVAWQKHGAS